MRHFRILQAQEVETEYMSVTGDKIQPGPKVIKLFSCSTQLSTKFIMLVNVKMPTITFISMIIALSCSYMLKCKQWLAF